jgi:hypothetical protein
MPSGEIEHSPLRHQDPVRIAAYGQIQLSNEKSTSHPNGSFVGSDKRQAQVLAVEPCIDDVFQQVMPECPSHSLALVVALASSLAQAGTS